LNIGRLDPQKDQVTLLRAFARLARRRDAGLIILGEGRERGRLERLARDLGVADRVIMPGWVPSIEPYFRAADLFVLSSAYEGFGLVLVEALSQGVPVVSTDCPSGPAEILADGRYGRLVPVGDDEALADAMEEELVSPRPPELLCERAAHFSPEGAAMAYERCFARVLAG
jgi:glycosyltransferase involved in cell wall biosynthesis